MKNNTPRRSLLLLLTLCLLVSLLALPALADDNVGDSSSYGVAAWSGESSAVSYSNGILTISGDGTLTLASDFTATIYVTSGTVTIDTAGYTLTQGVTASSSNTAPYAATIYIGINANVTITGSGTVQNTANSSSNIAGSAAVYNNGTCTIESGTFKTVSSAGKAWYTILNHGTMTINGGTFTNSDAVSSSGSSLIENGYYDSSSASETVAYVSGTNEEYPTLTINGGDFEADSTIAIKNDENGILEINDGTFDADNQSVMNWSTATLNGGTYYAGVVCWRSYVDTAVASTEDPTITITGGTYYGEVSAQAYVASGAEDESTQTPTIIIEDGTFEAAIYASDNSEIIIEDGDFNSSIVSDEEASITIYDGDFSSYLYATENSSIEVYGGEFTSENALYTDSTGEITIYHGSFADDSASDYVADSTTSGQTVVTTTDSSGNTVIHTLGRYVAASSGDCWTDGNRAYWICSDCGAILIYSGGTYRESTLSSVTIAGGHDYRAVETVDPTCTEKGYTLYECTVCGDTYKANKTATIDHDYEAEVTIPATTTSEGLMTYTCTVCGDTYTEVIPMLEADDEGVDTEAEVEDDSVTVTLFTDVQDSSTWYYDAVYWAAAEGITTGTAADLFSPDQTITRKELVTMLYRAAGSPDVTGLTTDFVDIYGTQYADFYDAILWAESTGLTTGKGSALTFCPDDTVTRAEIVTFLQRYEVLIAGGDGTCGVVTEKFIDVTDPDEWYYAPVYWAYDNGITEGNSAWAFTFGPDDACTRAEFVTFLYRYAA